jgi:hypothetical protein
MALPQQLKTRHHNKLGFRLILIETPICCLPMEIQACTFRGLSRCDIGRKIWVPRVSNPFPDDQLTIDHSISDEIHIQYFYFSLS